MSWTRDAWRCAGRVCRAGQGRAAPAASAAPTAPRRTAPRRRRQPEPTPSRAWRDWVGVLAMVTGLFLAIMDVQIVTSSLTQIQGGLSASADEIAWVQTAYLIADVVMVPLSGTLSRLLSTRVAVRHRGARLHRRQRAVRDRDQPRPDDPLSRDAGVLRRRDHAERVPGRLYEVPRRAAGDAAW